MKNEFLFESFGASCVPVGTQFLFHSPTNAVPQFLYKLEIHLHFEYKLTGLKKKPSDQLHFVGDLNHYFAARHWEYTFLHWHNQSYHSQK